MKKFFGNCILVLVFSIGLFAQKQTTAILTPFKNGSFISVTRISPDNKGDWLHSVANRFSDTVGSLLKQNYPAKVQNIHVSLNRENGVFVLTYECEIVSCEESRAMWFFDHRGALGKITDNENDVHFRAQDQAEIAAQQFKISFGTVEIIEHPLVILTRKDTVVLAIKEFFLASPRKSTKKVRGQVPK